MSRLGEDPAASRTASSGRRRAMIREGGRNAESRQASATAPNDDARIALSRRRDRARSTTCAMVADSATGCCGSSACTIRVTAGSSAAASPSGAPQAHLVLRRLTVRQVERRVGFGVDARDALVFGDANDGEHPRQDIAPLPLRRGQTDLLSERRNGTEKLARKRVVDDDGAGGSHIIGVREPAARQDPRPRRRSLLG